MIPTPHVIGVRRWGPTGETNAHGVELWAHGDPEPVPVHAVGPSVRDREPEPDDPRRWVVVDGLTVYAPAGTRVAAEDLVLWPTRLLEDGSLDLSSAQTHEVVGPVDDWTTGPWRNPVAGVTVNLERVKG